MAGRFENPFPQFFNSTPAVYASGVLRFYASGTSTPLSIYSNEGLTTGAATSITLNSAGRSSTDIFLQDLEYKVTLEDSSGNIIWTADPVSARDSSYVAKTITGSGSPNGSVAGTAGSSSVLPDFYWDYTNSILYVCTTTGSSSTAVWTAVNSSAATPAVPPPQGRLTLTSATPVTTADVTTSAAVYYTPYVGSLVPIYNGASFVPTTFAELTLTLVASHAANTNYDVFVFSDSGVVTIVTGPAWTSDTGRGTGAGTTELTRISGLRVNAVSMTGRNGSTTYTIAANRATYLGTFRTTGSNGDAVDSAVKRFVWNCYNRAPRKLVRTETTASWNYTTATFRQANNSTSNQVAVVQGLDEDVVNVSVIASANNSTSTLRIAQIGIGLDSTTSETVPGSAFAYVESNGGQMRAQLPIAVGLGYHYLTWLEKGGGADTLTWTGGNIVGLCWG